MFRPNPHVQKTYAPRGLRFRIYSFPLNRIQSSPLFHHSSSRPRRLLRTREEKSSWKGFRGLGRSFDAVGHSRILQGAWNQSLQVRTTMYGTQKRPTKYQHSRISVDLLTQEIYMPYGYLDPVGVTTTPGENPCFSENHRYETKG